MKITKSSGEYEDFNPRKIYNTIRNAGGSRKIANETVEIVKKDLRKNVNSQEILETVLNNLKKEPGLSERYNMKRAIMALGPTGFPFEQFFARILTHYGYQTKTNQKLRGKRIIHEVDIVAKKEKKYMVECKYHNEIGNITRLHPAMYTYARFLDLNKYSFDEPWLVTNTKCSKDAVEYAKGVNLKITSWNYPKNESLRDLIQNKNLYPITILEEIKDETKQKLFEAGFIVVKDFENIPIESIQKKTRIKIEELKKIIEKINKI